MVLQHRVVRCVLGQARSTHYPLRQLATTTACALAAPPPFRSKGPPPFKSPKTAATPPPPPRSKVQELETFINILAEEKALSVEEADAAAPSPHLPPPTSRQPSTVPPAPRPLLSADKLPTFDYRTYPPDVSHWDRPRVLLVKEPATVDAVLAYMNSPVGLDIEWAPQFTKGGGNNPTALLQISDGQTILVIQTLSMLGNCPPGLRVFLENPEVLKLGVSILPDGKKIDKDLGVKCQGLTELNTLHKAGGHSSLAHLTAMYTGHELSKNRKVIMSNWAAAHLSAAQLAYAANDAQSAVHIYAGMRASALASGFAGPKGWSWDASYAQIKASTPRVPTNLVEQINERVQISGTTPSNFPPFGRGGSSGRPGGAKTGENNNWTTSWKQQKKIRGRSEGPAMLEGLTGGGAWDR